jgi:AcrR family transcriptional regulator
MRKYQQRARAEEAARTRMRIIEAVFERLRRRQPVAVDQIADDANVARSTVYAIFGSRAGLFDAVGRELAERSGYARLVEAKFQPDVRDQIRAGVKAASEMFAANRDIYRALRSMAQLGEPAMVKRMNDERANAMKRIARQLKEQGVLREGVSVKDAEHILWMLSSFESFDELYTNRGLSTARTVKLLIETVEGTLYAKS